MMVKMCTEGERFCMSMEMDLFATPEKQRQHPSVSLEKIKVRRKLIVDDDSEIGSVYILLIIVLTTHESVVFLSLS